MKVKHFCRFIFLNSLEDLKLLNRKDSQNHGKTYKNSKYSNIIFILYLSFKISLHSKTVSSYDFELCTIRGAGDIMIWAIMINMTCFTFRKQFNTVHRHDDFYYVTVFLQFLKWRNEKRFY